jgi:hypothetical protein
MTVAWIAAASLISAVSMVAWTGALFGCPSTESGERARERGSEGSACRGATTCATTCGRSSRASTRCLGRTARIPLRKDARRGWWLLPYCLLSPRLRFGEESFARRGCARGVCDHRRGQDKMRFEHFLDACASAHQATSGSSSAKQASEKTKVAVPVSTASGMQRMSVIAPAITDAFG